MGAQAVITNMKILLRLALSAYVAFMINMLLTLVFGPTGIVAVRDLNQYRKRLESNIGQLSVIHTNLNAQLERLVSDKETIALLARQLGYFEENEGSIRIPGYRAGRNSYVIGSIVFRSKRDTGAREVIRIAALGLGALTFVCSGLLRRRLGDLL
jgi:cell division protein FtsB